MKLSHAYDVNLSTSRISSVHRSFYLLPALTLLLVRVNRNTPRESREAYELNTKRLFRAYFSHSRLLQLISASIKILRVVPLSRSWHLALYSDRVIARTENTKPSFGTLNATRIASASPVASFPVSSGQCSNILLALQIAERIDHIPSLLIPFLLEIRSCRLAAMFSPHFCLAFVSLFRLNSIQYVRLRSDT